MLKKRWMNDPNDSNELNYPNDPNDPNDQNDPNDWMTESFSDDLPYGIFLCQQTYYQFRRWWVSWFLNEEHVEFLIQQKCCQYDKRNFKYVVVLQLFFNIFHDDNHSTTGRLVKVVDVYLFWSKSYCSIVIHLHGTFRNYNKRFVLWSKLTS